MYLIKKYSCVWFFVSIFYNFHDFKQEQNIHFRCFFNSFISVIILLSDVWLAFIGTQQSYSQTDSFTKKKIWTTIILEGQVRSSWPGSKKKTALFSSKNIFIFLCSVPSLDCASFKLSLIIIGFHFWSGILEGR